MLSNKVAARLDENLQMRTHYTAEAQKKSATKVEINDKLVTNDFRVIRKKTVRIHWGEDLKKNNRRLLASLKATLCYNTTTNYRFSSVEKAFCAAETPDETT